MVLKEICSIIQTYMGLPDGAVYLRKEKVSQTKMQDFNITVGFMSTKPIGTSVSMVNGVESISSIISSQVVIEIYGRDDSILTRRNEIFMAMSSTLCKEAQIAKGFSIARDPSSFNDISGIDGAAIPYRFQATFTVQFIQSKTSIIDYYDQFREVEIKT